MSVPRVLSWALYGFGCHAATQWHANSAWMHDNAIHDFALACWTVLLPPIKRAAIQTNLAYRGKLSAIGSGTARYSLRRHSGFDCDLCSSRLSSSTENPNDPIDRARADDSTQVKNGRPSASCPMDCSANMQAATVCVKRVFFRQAS